MARTAIGPLASAVASALDLEGIAAVARFVDDRTLLHLPGASGLAGDYQGRDAICGLLERMATACDGTLRFETLCTTADGRRGVRLHGRLYGSRLGRALAASATLETALKDDIIREAWLACPDEAAWDAFWA